MHRKTEEYCSTFSRLTFNQRHSGGGGSTSQENILKAEGWNTLGRRPRVWDNGWSWRRGGHWVETSWKTIPCVIFGHFPELSVKTVMRGKLSP